MIPDILQIPLSASIMEKAPTEFNKTRLKEANEKLQNTTSDKSFLVTTAVEHSTIKDETQANDQTMEP